MTKIFALPGQKRQSGVNNKDMWSIVTDSHNDHLH